MKKFIAGFTAVATTAIIAASGGVAAAQSNGPTSKWCMEHHFGNAQQCAQAWKNLQSNGHSHHNGGGGNNNTNGNGGSKSVNASATAHQSATLTGNSGNVTKGYGGGGHNTTTNNFTLSLNNVKNVVVQFVINVFN